MATARLADLLVGLSRCADLGFGLPAGAAVRSCVLATRLARALDLPTDDVRAAFYTALLHHVGCAGYAHESARLFGDDLATNRAAGRTDPASATDLVTTFLPALTRGHGPVRSGRLVLAALTGGERWGREFTATACELGRDSARRLQLPPDVQTALFHVFDLWHGRNPPGALSGDDIPVASRIARLTGVAVLFASVGGPAAALDAVRRRGGGMLDPHLVTLFLREAATWLDDLDEVEVSGAVLAAEPVPHVQARDVHRVGEVFGDLVDLKSPYLLGHSRGVAALARGAAAELGLPEPVGSDLVLAASLHDVGRVAVSTGVWDKPGRLSADEQEQVRLHPYHSERILAASTRLAPVAGSAGRHHERVDGSGYHRGATARELSVPARVLAAADGYRARVERRPHRPALSPAQARTSLLEEARDGRLDASAVQAVLAAAGHRQPARRPHPAGLSDREVQVLALVARGCTNAEVARALVISRRTAEHHVQHVYARIGVSSRAAAAVFAVEHGLLDGGGAAAVDG